MKRFPVPGAEELLAYMVLTVMLSIVLQRCEGEAEVGVVRSQPTRGLDHDVEET